MLQLGIYRSRSNRMLLGVCGGIAEHLGMSAKMVRFGTIALAILIPGVSVWVVLIGYAVLGIVLPQEESLNT